MNRLVRFIFQVRKTLLDTSCDKSYGFVKDNHCLKLVCLSPKLAFDYLNNLDFKPIRYIFVSGSPTNRNTFKELTGLDIQ